MLKNSLYLTIIFLFSGFKKMFTRKKKYSDSKVDSESFKLQTQIKNAFLQL